MILYEFDYERPATLQAASAKLRALGVGARIAAGGTDLLPNSCMQWAEDETWDAGDMGCGELVLALRMRLREMPGRTLKLIARDAGAPEDIPAYCRMTGHELRHVEGHAYWIRAHT